MSGLIDDPKITPEAIEKLKVMLLEFPSARWAVYQNHDMGSPDFKEIEFLMIGPENHYRSAPAQMPDSHLGTGWRYQFVGWLDLETGKIVEGERA